jgi:hypothetical protein
MALELSDVVAPEALAVLAVPLAPLALVLGYPAVPA